MQQAGKTVIPVEPYQRGEGMGYTGAEIRNNRIEFGISQESLAAFVGVPEKEVRLWEGNVLLPDGEQTIALQLAFHYYAKIAPVHPRNGA